jgi:DNA-binding winged helix-turn-helix (wHTH) protein
MLVTLFTVQGNMGADLTTPAFLAQIPLFYLLAALSGYLAQGRIRRLEEQEAVRRVVRLEEGARSLSGAVRTIQEALDLGGTLQDIADAAPRLTGLPHCLVGLIDRKSGALITRATTTDRTLLGVDRLDYLVEWPREGSLTSEVLAFRQPVALREVTEESPLLPHWADRLKLDAILAVPLSSRGVDVGVIFFYGVPRGYAFTAHEVALAQQFADIVALVAINAQLYEDVQVTVATVVSELHPVVMPVPEPKARRLPVVEIGDLTVDTTKRQAKISDRVINLTPTEFDLLAVLAENTGHAVDQESLLRRVWGEDYHGRATVVDVGVHRLRRKIEDSDGAPRRIVTVRGRGYMLVPGQMIPRQGEER